MHRIDTPEAVAGLFQDGDPLIPLLATYIDAAWANAVQEEIVNVVIFAGLVLDKEDHTQLVQAILALIQDAIADHEADPDAHPQYLKEADHMLPGTHTEFVRHDTPQGLDVAQQRQARQNIDAASKVYLTYLAQ